MLDQVHQTIERYKMFRRGDRVLVAVSGGVDSVVLLHILKELEDYRLSLGIAHFDHAIRSDSAHDAEFVKELAESLKLPYYTERANVIGYAKAQKLSLEAAARMLRSRFLEKIAKTRKFKRIALGHNLNDQAETLLMRLLRGAGLEGLAGMPPVRPASNGVIYVRPLLECAREEIERFARAHRLAWREDPTNRETKILRNRIRHVLLPLLERDYNPNLLEILGRTARLLAEASSYLQEVAELELISLITRQERDEMVLDLRKFLMRPHCLRPLILRRAIERVKNLKDIEAIHIHGVLAWLERGGTGEQQLTGGLRLLRRHQRLIITMQTVVHPANLESALPVPGETLLSEFGWRFQTRLIPPSFSESFRDKMFRKSKQRSPGKREHVIFVDADKISGSLVVRTRRPGDRICLKEGTKKLQDFFVDKKISREERDTLPLICDAHRVIWITGWCISEAHRATPQTIRIISILAERVEVPEETA